MTFRNRHSLVSGFLCTIIFISGACALGGCVEITEPQGIGSTDEDGRMPLTIRAIVSDYIAIGEDGAPTTRIPTENGFTTEFEDGDAIGIFALVEYETPDVATVDDVYNLKLVYTKAADGTGSWAPEDDTKALYSYNDDLTYIAYYPYRDGVTIKQDNYIEIFKRLARDLPPAADQSTPEAYTGSDLMAAFAKPTTDPTDANKKVLTLAFEHLHALLVLNPWALIECVPPAGTNFEYAKGTLVQDLTVEAVTMNRVKALRMDDGTFRAIIPAPSAAFVPSGNYLMKGKKTVLFTGASLAAGVLTAGKCYTQEVETAVYTDDPMIRPLKVGDYFSSGGQVIPHDMRYFGSIPECIGIVFYVGPGPNDAISNYSDTNISGDIHGYVVALKDAYPSDTDKKWGRRVVYFGSGQTTQFDGYTKKYAEQTNELCQAAAEIRNFRTVVPVPPNASNWYMPSFAQLQTIWNAYKHSEEGVIYRSLQKLGGDLFAGQLYWTVTERQQDDIFCINMQTGASSDRNGKCSGYDMGWSYNAYGGIHLTRVILTF